MNRVIRILHIVGGLDRAGTETWVVNLRRHAQLSRFAMDFVVHRKDAHYAYADEIQSLGSTLIACEGHEQPLTYARHLTREMRRHGPYDIVHAHLQFYNGI